jgi:outer membrane protein TolC
MQLSRTKRAGLRISAVRPQLASVLLAAVAVAVGTPAAGAQSSPTTAGPGASASSGASSGSGSSRSGSSGSTGLVSNTSSLKQAQGQLQQLSGSGQSGGNGVSEDSFRGSLVTGTATAGVIDLSLEDAVQRGLRQNLGYILQSSSVQSANGQRLEQLQELLPTVTGSASISVNQVNLAAYGLKFPGLNPIVGPFQVVDFRGYLTQRLLDVQSLQNYLATKHNFEGSKLTAQDAREMVVLTVGNAYLLCLTDGARVEATRSQLATAKVTLDQATAAHDAGTSPKLDVLRAQVDYQSEEQNLISATNQVAKDKIALARTIGLPLDQAFQLTDSEPFKALDAISPDAALQQALKNRKDIAGDQETVKAAEHQKTAAWAEQLPAASFSGDFGDLGTTPGHSHGTYTATGKVSAPILQIAQTRGNERIADSQFQTARARLSDDVQQVNADIRDSLLDVAAAAKLVETARSNVDLAHEALNEAQERFRAGVDDNLPVSQAQTQTEQANDQYISALYQHNVAKLSLARAMGIAETNYKDYLGGK